MKLLQKCKNGLVKEKLELHKNLFILIYLDNLDIELLFQRASSSVSSSLQRLTTKFGMDWSGSTAL